MALNYRSSLIRYRQYLQENQASAMWQAGLYTVLSLTLITVLVIFALRPTLVTIAGLLGQIREEKVLYERMAQKSLAIQQATNELQKQEDRLGVLMDGLPAEANWQTWLQTVDEVEKDSGVKLVNVEINGIQVSGKQINPPPKTAVTDAVLPKDVVGVPFLINVKGTYEEIKQFGETLESRRRIVMYSEVGITKDKDGTLAGAFSGTIGYFTRPQSP